MDGNSLDNMVHVQKRNLVSSAIYIMVLLDTPSSRAKGRKRRRHSSTPREKKYSQSKKHIHRGTSTSPLSSKGKRKHCASRPSPAQSDDMSNKKHKKASASALESGEGDFISKEMERFVQLLQLTPAEIEFRQQLIETISSEITSWFDSQAKFSTPQVHVFGSSSSGLGSFRSDIDLMLCFPDLFFEKKVSKKTLRLAAEKGKKKVKNRDSHVWFKGHGDEVMEEQSEVEEPQMDVQDEDDSSMTLNLNFDGGNVTPKTPKHRQLPKTKQILLLKRLYKMMSKSELWVVELRTKCATPILHLIHAASHIEIDIGINRDQGIPVDIPAELCQQLSSSRVLHFQSLAVLVKEFLFQANLHKPYHGGLGGHKVYLLVAHFLINGPRARSSKSPPGKKRRSLGQSFVELLKFYRQSEHLHRQTQLQIHLTKSGYTIQDQFRTTFEISKCVQLFQDLAQQISTATSSSSFRILPKLIRPDVRQFMKHRIQTFAIQSTESSAFIENIHPDLYPIMSEWL